MDNGNPSGKLDNAAVTTESVHTLRTFISILGFVSLSVGVVMSSVKLALRHSFDRIRKVKTGPAKVLVSKLSRSTLYKVHSAPYKLHYQTVLLLVQNNYCNQ